jgi:hypothetical protein
MEETKRERPPFIPHETREHAKAAAHEFRESVGAIFPPEVGEHARAAQKEALLAVRSLIDAYIDHLDRRRTSSPVPAGQ